MCTTIVPTALRPLNWESDAREEFYRHLSIAMDRMQPFERWTPTVPAQRLLCVPNADDRTRAFNDLLRRSQDRITIAEVLRVFGVDHHVRAKVVAFALGNDIAKRRRGPRGGFEYDEREVPRIRLAAALVISAPDDIRGRMERSVPL